MLSLFKFSSANTIEAGNPVSTIKTICELEKDNEKLSIRTMSYDELNNIRIIWTKEEGWPSVKYGMAATYELDPNGYYCLEKDGEKMATVSVVAYPGMNLAYIGIYIVPKIYRARGYGKLILEETIKYTAEHRGITTFGLNCLASMSPMYKKFGFETNTVDDIWKFTVKGNVFKSNFFKSCKENVIDVLDEYMFFKLVHFDAAIFGVSRPQYLNRFIHKANTITLICKEGDQIKGYGIISEREPAKMEPHTSYRIGPLYSENVAIANALLAGLITAVNLKTGEYIFLEGPGTHLRSGINFEELGFEKVISMLKMYKGVPPKHDAAKIFCYSSLVTGG